jgi:hypothetical protein
MYQSSLEKSSPQIQHGAKFDEGESFKRSGIGNYAKIANEGIQESLVQLQGIANGKGVESAPSQGRGGLPGPLKSGIESLSGIAMADVRVHYNSSKPAQLQAHAYAQGSDIHLAPGQEKHLPHEAWHVVQQKQGRVKPTLQLKGVAINDDSALEREADVMGARAMGGGKASQGIAQLQDARSHFTFPSHAPIFQLVKATFNGLSADEKEDAKASFQQYKGQIVAFKSMQQDVECYYINDTVRAVLNAILGQFDVDTKPALNRQQLCDYVGVRLIDAPRIDPNVSLVWGLNGVDELEVKGYPKLMAGLEDYRNYHQANGQPGFANAHIDDTKSAQWKLQADVEVRGAGSKDRLHINVVVLPNGDFRVSIVKFSRNTH